MKKIIICLLIVMAFIPLHNVFAQEDIKIEYNGEPIIFSENSIVINNRTLVQLRPIAETLDLGIEYALESGSVILSDANSVVIFKQNSDIVNVNGTDIKMDAPMMIHNNYSFVPVRNLVEPFGNEINYDNETKIITITPKSAQGEKADYVETVDENKDKSSEKEYIIPFYYQAEPEFGFEKNGKGYCWVCSYAMLFSSSSGKNITPVDIEEYNLEGGYDGNYMAGHETLANEFDLELVPALSEDSPYFGGYDLKNRGETSLIVENDEDVVEALREALENFPAGVIVRYEGYPHTMVAVEVDGDDVYFNDPGIKDGEHILFEDTCLNDFSLSDISFIQAVK